MDLVEKVRAIAATLPRDLQFEVYAAETESTKMDSEMGAIRGGQTVTRRGYAIRVIENGRFGYAHGSMDSDPSKILNAARTAAKVSKKLDAVFPEMHPAKTSKLHKLELESGQLANQLEEIHQALSGQDLVIQAGTGVSNSSMALLNSKGLERSDAGWGNSLYASVVLPDGETAVSSWESVESYSGLASGKEMAAEVLARVQSLRNPTTPPSGDMDLILMPGATSELLHGLLESASDGHEIRKGRSGFAQKLGTKVGDEGLQFIDDPFAIKESTTNWDGDGMATHKQHIIEDGKFVLETFDLRSAAENGAKSTAHCSRGGPSSEPGAGLHHSDLTHTNVVKLDELIGDVKQGVLVESLLGAHTANEVTGEFSVSAPNAWEIRDGAIVNPIQEVAISGSVFDWLHKIDAVSKEAKLSGGATLRHVRVRDVAIRA